MSEKPRPTVQDRDRDHKARVTQDFEQEIIEFVEVVISWDPLVTSFQVTCQTRQQLVNIIKLLLSCLTTSLPLKPSYTLRTSVHHSYQDWCTTKNRYF